MRLACLVLVIIFTVVDLRCAFACIYDIENKLGKEQKAVCHVGEKSLENCISCECIKENTLLCTRVCQKKALSSKKFCFRPQLQKRMYQKLSSLNFVENRYKKLAKLATNCVVGERVVWEGCKCCSCGCAKPGIIRCSAPFDLQCRKDTYSPKETPAPYDDD